MSLSLYRLLVDPPALDQFNKHIQAVIVPRVVDQNPEYIHYPVEFVNYVVNVVLPSPLMQDKKFLCLLWYSAIPSYQTELEHGVEAKKLARFKQLLWRKLDNFVAGIQTNGETFNFKNNNSKQNAYKRTLGYFLDRIRKDYTSL